MMRSLGILFTKEWREFTRDRRTLFLTCVMPLVFYPAAMGMFGYLGAEQDRNVREAPLRVGVVGEELGELWRGARAAGVVHEFPSQQAGEADLRAGRVDVLLAGGQSAAGWQVVMYCWGTAEREGGQNRARLELAEIEKILVARNLDEAGIHPAVIAPLHLVEVDRAPVREAAGSKVGGIVAYFLIFLAFTGCMATAVDVVAGEKERGTLESVLATPVDVRLLMLAKLGFVTLTGMLSALCSLAGLVAVGLLAAAPEVRAGVQGILDPGTLGVVLALVSVAALLFAAVMLNLSLLARSAKEAQGWTSPFFLTVSLVLIYAMLPGINANGPMAWVPVVNLSLAVREALCGTLSTSLLVLAMGETLLLGALAIAVGGRMARSEATLFRGA